MSGNPQTTAGLPLNMLFHQFAVFDAVRGSVFAHGTLVLLVLAVRAFEEDNFRVALEREDVRCDTVEEPAVVRNDYRTAGEVLQTFLAC